MTVWMWTLSVMALPWNVTFCRHGQPLAGGADLWPRSRQHGGNGREMQWDDGSRAQNRVLWGAAEPARSLHYPQHSVGKTCTAPSFKHCFLTPSSKLCQNWLCLWGGTLYLYAAVYRCGPHPPKCLGTDNTLEATQHPNTCVNVTHICPWLKKKKFGLNSNDFGFIGVGVSSIVSYKRNVCSNLSCLLQTYCHLSIIEKLYVSRQFSETCGVINCGSGWRKDVVNQCLEFGTALLLRRDNFETHLTSIWCQKWFTETHQTLNHVTSQIYTAVSVCT